jgi:5-methylcytosine-specific restriction endonuclease McrA
MSSQRNNRMRAKLYIAQHGNCGICGRKLKSLAHCTIEHVVPRALGGRSDGNRVVAHRSCNEAKGDREPNGCELIWLSAANARLAV